MSFSNTTNIGIATRKPVQFHWKLLGALGHRGRPADAEYQAMSLWALLEDAHLDGSESPGLPEQLSAMRSEFTADARILQIGSHGEHAEISAVAAVLKIHAPDELVADKEAGSPSPPSRASRAAARGRCAGRRAARPRSSSRACSRRRDKRHSRRWRAFRRQRAWRAVRKKHGSSWRGHDNILPCFEARSNRWSAQGAARPRSRSRSRRTRATRSARARSAAGSAARATPSWPACSCSCPMPANIFSST